jgi:hypothetical protein
MAFRARTTLTWSSRIACLMAATTLLAACVGAPVPTNYAPSSTKTATGALTVSDFRYLPSEPDAPKRVAPDVIRNTAVGKIKIDKEVRVFVRDAVFTEMRFVGIKVNDPHRVLTGDIE